MIIHPPQLEEKHGQIQLAAFVQVEKDNSESNFPHQPPCKAFFRFPSRLAGFCSGRSDAFAAALLPLAMARGETLHVRGTCSPRLAFGLDKLQHLFHWWFPGKLQKINIKADHLLPLDETQAGEDIAALFSGGIDSAYTLMEHLPARQGASPSPSRLQITHALFVHGLDIPLQNSISFQHSAATFRKHLEPLGVELLPGATNLHYFYTGVLKWEIAHGCVTIAAGLALDRLIGTLLVPATHSLHHLKPWGSTPITDPWLSTETIHVIHHGAAARRFEKTIALTNWQPARHILRVCVNEKQRMGVKNCGTCEKCLRTRVMLHLIGAGEAFPTLPPLNNAFEMLRWTPVSGAVWVPALIRFCWKNGKRWYIPLLILIYIKSLVYKLAFRLTPRPIFRWLRKTRFPPETDPFHPASLPPEECA